MGCGSILVGGGVNAIEDIVSCIRGASEDARFEAWMTLYSSTDVATQEEILRIISGRDNVLKMLLARFLAFIREEKAVTYLRDMLFDEEKDVVEVAAKAFDKNAFEGKLKKLLAVLHAPNSDARVFALERLSQGGMKEALPILIKMLKSADENLMTKIFSGLRYLPDKKLLYEIKPYVSHENEEIRFRTALIYGSLFEEKIWSAHRVLIDLLRDPSPRIRQAVLWSLRKRPHHRDFKYLMMISSQDPDPMVRQESLLGFTDFPSAKAIRQLLFVVVNDSNRMVVLKGESILISMPVKKLIIGLKGLLNVSDRRIVNKAMLLFAEFQKNSVSYYKYLVKGLHRAGSDKDKIPYIEALGIMGRFEAVSELESLLNESPLISYTALTAILRIWGRREDFTTLKYMTYPGFSNVMKQIVLKHFLKADNLKMYERDLTDHFIWLLGSSNLNLRYLAAQALSKIPENFIVDPLLQMMLKETDPSSIKLLRENIANILKVKPDLFPEIFERYRHNEAAVHLIFGYLREVPIVRSQLIWLFTQLFTNTHSFLVTEHGEEFAELICQFLVGCKLAPEDILEALRSFDLRNVVLDTVVRGLKSLQGIKLTLSVPKFMTELKTRNDFSKKPLIELLALSDSPEAIPALVSVSCDDTLSEFHQAASRGLGKVMGLKP